MRIEILGTGCAKCQSLEHVVRETVSNLGLDAEIVKVNDINDIIEYGAVMTPALVVNGEVKSSGRVPPKEEMEQLLSDQK
ncbi:thioredoxin family protein [Candidatus Thorarchaeota archaeon]|nr:MAG: thioredoxin family protein [Candidatus Thorarchaeota archaeon]